MFICVQPSSENVFFFVSILSMNTALLYRNQMWTTTHSSLKRKGEKKFRKKELRKKSVKIVLKKNVEIKAKNSF